MIQNLVVLNSSYTGSRDLYWVDSMAPNVVGYNIYRAYDYPTNWTKVNITPHPGHFYRDETSLTLMEYTVQDKDWVSLGGDGQFVFRLPETPIWSGAVKGRPSIANHPEDVKVTLDGDQLPVARVDGQESLVYIENQMTLRKGGPVSSSRPHPFVKNEYPTAVLKVEYKKLNNFVDIWIAGTRSFYTVVPVVAGGVELHAPGATGTEVKNTLEIDQMDYIYAEMVRRNAFLFEQVGEPASLMIRKTKGERCGCMVANGEPRTGCASCFETGIVGGYFGPYNILFIDPDSAIGRTMDEGGVKVERESRSYLGPTPIVQAGDFIVRRNGDRMVIGEVTYKTPRGILLQQDFAVSLLPSKDTRYMIPLIPDLPTPPQIYDPRFVDTRTLPAEPLTDPRTDPTKTWENPKVPQGRTVTFGNIMT